VWHVLAAKTDARDLAVRMSWRCDIVFICGGGSLKAYITDVAPKVVMDFANMLYKDGIQVSAIS